SSDGRGSLVSRSTVARHKPPEKDPIFGPAFTHFLSAGLSTNEHVGPNPNDHDLDSEETFGTPTLRYDDDDPMDSAPNDFRDDFDDPMDSGGMDAPGPDNLSKDSTHDGGMDAHGPNDSPKDNTHAGGMDAYGPDDSPQDNTHDDELPADTSARVALLAHIVLHSEVDARRE
ncbi:hypothetical protein DXG01_012943, partial [Tephrocybe rancida]